MNDSGQRSTAALEAQSDVSPSGPEPDTYGPPPGPRRSLAERFESLSLLVAPLLIVALIGLWLLHRRSLDLENANIQMRTTLDWETALQPQLVEHLQIAFWSTVIVILVAVPLGIALTRPRLRGISPYILTVANSGQALPAYGLLVVFLTWMGQGKITVIWALALYALLPVLRNTMVGLDGVDRAVIEAGRGMGMTRLGVLARIEMPLAVPVIIAGIRTAMIINIGMATLAFLIGGGALGVAVFAGIQLSQEQVIISAAWLVAIVALSFDWVGAVAERYLRPRGL